MLQKIKSFSIITISVVIMAIGVYYFKFPNNFCFGGGNDVICRFITEELNKSAAIVNAKGAYTNEDKYLIFTTLTRKQAAAVRSFIHENHLTAFISMSSTSEVFGKGFSSI